MAETTKYPEATEKPKRPPEEDGEDFVFEDEDGENLPPAPPGERPEDQAGTDSEAAGDLLEDISNPDAPAAPTADQLAAASLADVRKQAEEMSGQGSLGPDKANKLEEMIEEMSRIAEQNKKKENK